MWKGKPEQNVCVDVTTICTFDQHKLINITNVSLYNSNNKQKNIIWLRFGRFIIDKLMVPMKLWNNKK